MGNSATSELPRVRRDDPRYYDRPTERPYAPYDDWAQSAQAPVRSTHTLPVADAWALAMAFAEELQGRVRLVTRQGADVAACVETYEWIQFHVPASASTGGGDDPELRALVATMRAAGLVWAALAACPGYGPGAFPTFWKRVFSDLQEEYGDVPRISRGGMPPRFDIPPVTDATRLFARPDARPFPRFLLRTHMMQLDDPSTLGLYRVFCGLEAGKNDVIEAKLRSAWAKLEPYVRQTAPDDDDRRARPIDVGITSGIYSLESCAVLGTLVDELRALVAATRAPQHAEGASDPFYRPFAMVALEPLETIAIDSIATVEALAAAKVEVGELRIELMPPLAPAETMTVFQSLMGTPGSTHRIRVRTLAPSFFLVHSPAFGALCSALSQTTTLEALKICNGGSNDETMPDVVWAWLGYAMFRPRAAGVASSWRQLSLSDVHPTERAVTILQRMAVGNNLLSFLQPTGRDQDEDICAGYISATVDAGTAIRAEPRYDALILMIPSDHLQCDVCVKSVAGVSEAEWAAIVLPGWGLVWVPSRALRNISVDRPSVSQIERLFVYSRDQGSFASWRPVFELLGANLLAVDLSFMQLDASALKSLLMMCPRLASLQVSHDGSLWASSEPSKEIAQLPRLEQIELRITQSMRYHIPSIYAWKTSLMNLRDLRISSFSPKHLKTSRADILEVLRRYRQIRYFHWCDQTSFYRSNKFPTPYGKIRGELPKLLGIQRGVHDVCDGPIQSHCAVAFLSVVKQLEQRGSAGGKLDRDVLMNVFSLATGVVSRELWADL